jgi:putative DNA primase/helicase
MRTELIDDLKTVPMLQKNFDGPQQLVNCLKQFYNGIASGLWDNDRAAVARELFDEFKRWYAREWKRISREIDAQTKADAKKKRDQENLEVPPGGIMIFDRQMPDIAREAVAALVKRNTDAPRVFMFGQSLARINGGEIDILNDDKAAHELAQAASWYTVHYRKRVAAFVPSGVVNYILATRADENPLPVLDTISRVPLIRADGTICQTDGYDAASRCYFTGLAGIKINPVPDCPTADDISAARQLIAEELLGDFPFDGDADLATAVGLLLTPFARSLINGPVPPAMFEKPVARTGATLLVEVLTFPTLGDWLQIQPWPTEEAEREKTILSQLIKGPAFIAFDNVGTFINSPAFSAATTASVYSGRLLGHSSIVTARVRCAWAMMANNPTMSAEIAARMLRCRLDAKMADPSVGRTFRHPDIKQWVHDHRGDLVWAALVMIRGWITGGQPPGDHTIGMFENWCRVIGGILSHAGIPGLLSNRAEFLKRAAPDNTAKQQLMAEWFTAYGDKEIKTAEIIKLIDEHDLAFHVEGTGNDDKTRERSRARSMGRKLEAMEGQQVVCTVGDERLELKLIRGEPGRGGNRWALKVVYRSPLPGKETEQQIKQFFDGT